MSIQRRAFLGGALASLALPKVAYSNQPSRLKFQHAHTGEKLSVDYRESGHLVSEALGEINHILRDFRTDEVRSIDTGLLDMLATIFDQVDGRGAFEIISGFRSPRTNNMLRQVSDGVAEGSLHMAGLAIDVRLTSLDTADLRDAALVLKAGGVGYYPRSNFVHLDVGRVRRW